MFVSQEDRTALMWAAMNGHTAVVKALIEKGADLNATEKVRRRHYVSTGDEGMTKECFGPYCPTFSLQGVSVPLPVSVAFVTRTL